MSELGSIRFKDQFQMLIPKSDFYDGPHTAPPLQCKGKHQKGPFWNCVWNSDRENSRAYNHLICLSANYAKKYLGHLFHCLNIEDLGCLFFPLFCWLLSLMSVRPFGELSRSDTRVSAWMHGVGLLLPGPVPRLENHAYFPNSDLLAHCQSGHARAASQQKHIGKINLS